MQGLFFIQYHAVLDCVPHAIILPMDLPFLQLIIEYKYTLLLILATIDGPIVTMIAGFILKLGLISLLPAIGVIAVGDLAGDTAWYWIGRRWGRGFIGRFGRYFSITDAHVASVERIFHANTRKIFLTSKVTTGFGLTPLLLFTAGMARIPFGRFMAVNACGEIARIALYIGLGYEFGDLYSSIADGISKATFVVLLGVGLLAFLGLGTYFRDRFFPRIS